MNVNLFFSFLQFAIDQHNQFSYSLTNDDWTKLFLFCKKQALLGIGFTAVERLHERGVKCPVELKLKWYVAASQIEKINDTLNSQCRELMEQYEHDGLRCCILKGQGNLLNYPEHLKQRRNPGDIDIWCAAPKEGLPIVVQTKKDRVEYVVYHGYRAIIEYVRMLHWMVGNQKRPPIRYHHIDAPNIGKTHVEVHFKPAFCHSFLRNGYMQQWFKEQANVCMRNKNYLGFATPTPSVNVVYQMTHIFCHYFEEGLGLRQLFDYYYVLIQWHEQVSSVESGVWSEYREGLQSQGMWSEGLGVPVMSKEEVMRVLWSFGMGKFVAAVMWVLHEVFAIPTHYYICEPNEKEGRKLLEEIIQGGNFGQYDERGKDMRNGGTIPHAIWKLKRVMRLVSSYPEEAISEPFFRIYHLVWKILHSGK